MATSSLTEQDKLSSLLPLRLWIKFSKVPENKESTIAFRGEFISNTMLNNTQIAGYRLYLTLPFSLKSALKIHFDQRL